MNRADRLRTIARIAEAIQTAGAEWSEEERQECAERLGLGDWWPDAQMDFGDFNGNRNS